MTAYIWGGVKYSQLGKLVGGMLCKSDKPSIIIIINWVNWENRVKSGSIRIRSTCHAMAPREVHGASVVSSSTLGLASCPQLSRTKVTGL